jgi:hypothetical protein
MTVSNTPFREDMQGNGVTKDIPVRFYFMLETHLQVLRSTSTTVDVLVLGTDYTTTGAGVLAGGNVHLLVAPTAAQFVTVLPNIPYSQLTHYVEGDPFPAASHENALDLLTGLARQIKEELDRCVKAPANAAGFDGEMPPLFAGGSLLINATKTGFDLVTPSSGTGDLVFSSLPVYADNDAALAAGAIAGSTYRTPEGNIWAVVGGVTVSLTPIIQGILVSGTATLTAALTGTSDAGLTWAVDGVWNGDATTGTLTGTGLSRTYTAPADAGSHVITATSNAAPGSSASATVVCTAAPEVAVYLYPAVVGTVLVDSETALSAVVTGDADTSVIWDVDGTVGGSAALGTITGTGIAIIYTAPAAAGDHIITATSVADGAKSASKTITVAASSEIALTVAPSGALQVNAGEFVNIRVSIANSSETTSPFGQVLNLSVDGISSTSGAVGGNPAVGMLEGSSVGVLDGVTYAGVRYTAPATTGTHTLGYTSHEDPTVTASSTVVVSAVTPVVITLDPPDVVSVEAETTEVFTATITGAATGWTTRWFVDGAEEGSATVGALTGTGNSRTYTAPADAGTHTLSAYYSQDLTKYTSCTIFVTAAPVASAIPGFGNAVVGGTGGTTVHVTNTNDTGAGSLREAVANPNVIVVFDVGGTIALASALYPHSHTTIDGTDAPTDGITLTGHSICLLSIHEIIIKNIRHLGGWDGNGGGGGDADCISLFTGTHDVVIDHCSLSGNYDEGLSASGSCYNITFKDCIISGSIVGAKFGTMVQQGSYYTTYYHNIISSYYRNPNVGFDTTDATEATLITSDIVNNLIWNYQTYGAVVYHGGHVNIVGNYFYSSYHPGESGRAIQVNTGTRGYGYSSGNYSKDGSSLSGNAGSPFTVPAAAQITATSAATAAAYCYANAGCRVGGLDTHDQALIDAIASVGL